MELRLVMDEECTESLYVRIKERAGTGDIKVDGCYRPSHQEEQANEDLYRQIKAALHLQVLGGTSTSPLSVGGTIQKDISNPESSWGALIINSSSR